MKGCDLCHRAARIHCESDQASLCWKCDANVHGANFLVARHTRALLCGSCQVLTQWRAAGARLSPTISVCERCAADVNEASASEAEEESEGEDEMMEEDEDGDDDDNDAEEEEGDNQVVPWAQALTKPPPASSSSGEESLSPRMARPDFLKGMRDTADIAIQRDPTRSTSHRNHPTATPPQPPSLSATITASDPLLNDRRTFFMCQASPPSAASACAASHTYTRGDDTAVDIVFSDSRSPPI